MAAPPDRPTADQPIGAHRGDARPTRPSRILWTVGRRARGCGYRDGPRHEVSQGSDRPGAPRSARRHRRPSSPSWLRHTPVVATDPALGLTRPLTPNPPSPPNPPPETGRTNRSAHPPTRPQEPRDPRRPRPSPTSGGCGPTTSPRPPPRDGRTGRQDVDHAVVRMPVTGDDGQRPRHLPRRVCLHPADSAFAFGLQLRGQTTVAAGGDITFVAPARLGDVLIAEARVRAAYGRSGLTDVRVTLGRATARSSPSCVDDRGPSRLRLTRPPRLTAAGPRRHLVVRTSQGHRFQSARANGQRSTATSQP